MEVVDEDLTDPITLFGYEQPAEYRTELIKIDENKQTIESEHKDKEELKYVSSYRRKSFVPVSFFDIANNIRLLTICCPLSIKVIDCVKFPLHFKRRMDRVLDMNDRLKNTNDCLKNQSVKSKNNMNRLIGLRIIRTNIVIDIGSEDEYDDIEYIEIEKESSKRNAYLDDVDSAFQSVGTDLTSINNSSNATVIEPRNINENELQEKETNNKNSRSIISTSELTSASENHLNRSNVLDEPKKNEIHSNKDNNTNIRIENNNSALLHNEETQMINDVILKKITIDDKNTGNQDKGIAKRLDLLCSKPDNSVSSLETHKNRAPSHHKQVGLNTNTKTLYENGDNNISEKNSSLHEFKATLENNSNTNKTFDNTNEIHLDNDSNHLYVTKNVKKTNVNEINRETDTGNKVPQNKITTDGVKKDIKFPFLEFESDSTFLLLQSGSNNAPHTKHGSSNVCTKTTYIKNESKDICGNDKKSHNSKKKTRPDNGKVKSSSHRYRVEEKKTNIKILPVAHPYTLHKKKITNMTSNSKFKEAIDARNRAVKKNLPDAEKINKGKTIDDLPQQLSTPVRSSPSPLNPLQSSNSRNSSQWAVPQQIQTQQSLPGSAPPLYSFLPTTSLRPPETRLSPPSSIFQKPSHLPQQQGNSKQHQETRKYYSPPAHLSSDYGSSYKNINGHQNNNKNNKLNRFETLDLTYNKNMYRRQESKKRVTDRSHVKKYNVNSVNRGNHLQYYSVQKDTNTTEGKHNCTKLLSENKTEDNENIHYMNRYEKRVNVPVRQHKLSDRVSNPTPGYSPIFTTLRCKKLSELMDKVPPNSTGYHRLADMHKHKYHINTN